MSLAAVNDRSDEALLALESRVCSYGDTVHYAEQPKLFARCEGSYLYDRRDIPVRRGTHW